MKTLRVGLFVSRLDAEEIRNRLARAAIPARIQEESSLARLWFVSRRAAGFWLEVAAADAERTRLLLDSWESQPGEPPRAIRCPECGSLRVEYPQFTRKFFLPNLAMGLIAELGLLPKLYYCEDCHFTWSRELVDMRPTRRHMAPRYFIEDDPPYRPSPARRTGTSQERASQALLIHRSIRR